MLRKPIVIESLDNGLVNNVVFIVAGSHLQNTGFLHIVACLVFAYGWST